jgi:hypothetical protein
MYDCVRCQVGTHCSCDDGLFLLLDGGDNSLNVCDSGYYTNVMLGNVHFSEVYLIYTTFREVPLLPSSGKCNFTDSVLNVSFAPNQHRINNDSLNICDNNNTQSPSVV